jgi:DNA polymerase-3 subunit delta'
VSFENIIGHDRPKELIERVLKLGRLPHALMFDGPEGVGKTCFALALARRLSCEGDRTAACECRNCRRISHENHPGVVHLAPLLDKQEFPVEMVRTGVIEPLALKSMESGWRVFIFNESEKFNEASANVLLKTLEEPPPTTLLILETRSAGAVIETLTSRCQRIRFAPLPDSLVAGFIEKDRKIPAAEAAIVSKFAVGSIGRALSIIEKGLLETKNEFLDKYLASTNASLISTADELVAMVEGKTLEERRKKLYPLLDMLALYMRDVLVRRTAGDAEIFHVDRPELIGRNLPQVRSPEKLVASVESARQLVEENTNIKYVMLRLVRDYIEVKNAS